MPPRYEGLGRVVVEAFARGRGLVASRVGGIPDVARDGEEALLVEPGDVDELAAARRYHSWHTTPAEYAARVRSLVDASLEVGPVVGERPRVLLVAAGRADAAAAKALQEEIDLQ